MRAGWHLHRRDVCPGGIPWFPSPTACCVVRLVVQTWASSQPPSLFPELADRAVCTARGLTFQAILTSRPPFLPAQFQQTDRPPQSGSRRGAGTPAPGDGERRSLLARAGDVGPLSSRPPTGSAGLEVSIWGPSGAPPLAGLKSLCRGSSSECRVSQCSL